MAAEMSNCYRCGFAGEAAGDKCPNCGGRLRSARLVRGLGWLQLLIGLFLVGLMGTITYYLAPALLSPAAATEGARFTGTPGQALMILGLFGLVITFGVGSIAAGLWQIVTGRRNRWIFILMIVLFVVVMLAAWLTTASLKAS
jgi:MFS family permease